MIVISSYDEEQREKMRIANEDYVNSLKSAIRENRIQEFFNSFGFRPRYLELIDVLLCYPDGERIIFDFYNFMIENLKDIQIPSAVVKLAELESIQALLIEDFDKLLVRTLNDKSFADNIYSFMQGILKIPGGDLQILSKLDLILDNSDPTLIFSTLKLFESNTAFKEIMVAKFEKCIALSRGNSVVELIKYMLKNNRGYAIIYIKANMESILKNIGGGDIYRFLSIILDYEELIESVKQNIQIIISCSNNSDIIYILGRLDNKYGFGIQKNHNVLGILKEKLSSEEKTHLAIGAIVKSNRNEYIRTILNQLMEEEGVNDFSSIGRNSWSNIVFRVGRKVLKLGWIRNNPNCPEHYRIIKPDLFEVIYDQEQNPILYIEIQKCLDQGDISEADIQDLFDDIGRDGLIYIDPRNKCKSNFGLLNDSDWRDEYTDASVSFKRKKLVLVDRDCVWHAWDSNIRYMGMDED